MDRKADMGIMAQSTSHLRNQNLVDGCLIRKKETRQQTLPTIGVVISADNMRVKQPKDSFSGEEKSMFELSRTTMFYY